MKVLHLGFRVVLPALGTDSFQLQCAQLSGGCAYLVTQVVDSDFGYAGDEELKQIWPEPV